VPFVTVGRKRQLPVESRREGRVVLKASLTLPSALQPILAEHRGESPFRTLGWNLAFTADGALDLRVEERRKDAFFGLDKLEQAERAWRQDRSLVRSLLEDGMALKP
jgi:hypothetical protein